MDFLFDSLTEEFPESISSMPYIQNTVLGVMDKEQELLDIISANLASGWRVDRISKVSKKYADDVPEAVAINEAVELAKEFDEPETASFINGVLAGVVKK